MVGQILKGVMMKIETQKHTEYMVADKGFEILNEDKNGDIKAFKNLDNGKVYRI